MNLPPEPPSLENFEPQDDHVKRLAQIHQRFVPLMYAFQAKVHGLQREWNNPVDNVISLHLMYRTISVSAAIQHIIQTKLYNEPRAPDFNPRLAMQVLITVQMLLFRVRQHAGIALSDHLLAFANLQSSNSNR
jgi:hypothetical protein